MTVKKKFCDGWWLVKRGNYTGSVPQVNMKSGGHRQAPSRRQSLARVKKTSKKTDNKTDCKVTE